MLTITANLTIELMWIASRPIKPLAEAGPDNKYMTLAEPEWMGKFRQAINLNLFYLWYLWFQKLKSQHGIWDLAPATWHISSVFPSHILWLLTFWQLISGARFLLWWRFRASHIKILYCKLQWTLTADCLSIWACPFCLTDGIENPWMHWEVC